MTPADVVVIRNMADHAEGIRRLCQLVATALHAEPEAIGVGDALEALAWMAGHISDSLAGIADPEAN